MAGAGGIGIAGLDATPAQAARTVLVGTPAELEAAIAAALPGETIAMKNGTWRDIKVAFRATGSASSPITLRAESAGQVIISGESYLQIVGDHLVVDGLTFRDGAAPLQTQQVIGFGDAGDDGKETPGVTYANHCRLTNVVVDAFNKELAPAPEGTDIWVSLWGQHNRVDHCAFLGKTSRSKVIVGRGFDEQASYFQVDNNYFGNVVDTPYSAGSVAITLDKTDSLTDGSSVIEQNLFEDMQGRGRIVSLKCSNSTIRDNTFRRASGSICSRSGSFNTVERNFILPGLEEQEGFYTGGMLMIGEGHVIRQNYVQGCSQSGRGALELFEGNADNGPGVGSYYPTKDVVVENNTFIENYRSVVVGKLYDPENGIDVPVENVTYRENAILGDDASPISLIEEIDPPVGDVYQGNLFFGGNVDELGDVPGIEVADPGLMEQADGTYRYAETSPLRHNMTTLPLTKSDVGPTWPWQ
ncbi:polysaccharide lyase 6 family protein [Ruania zhangjianzhongii]|uniref:polysaccharide lyase 6 family protein n=1 Tax=Ruania zhangjianzhongii TaxID=2603206 RepID=UPI00143DB8A1|nr:polysaccharide lyase 6 family protein [Ruania zhangjianzhongii]